MTLRSVLLSFFVTSSFALTGMAAPVGPAGEDITARFDSAVEKNANGQLSTVIEAAMLPNGKHIEVQIPNEAPRKDAGGAKPIPKRDVMATVNKLKAGAIIKMSVEAAKNGPMPIVTYVEALEIKPGEDTPNGYVFDSTTDHETGKTTTTTVRLTKLGIKFEFQVIMRKGEKGEQVRDADVMKALQDIRQGSTVWVQTKLKSLTLIEPYTDPQIGKLGKSTTTEIDGHKVPSAEVETEAGKTVTVLVPLIPQGKMFVTDTVVNAQLRQLKVGARVAFRVHEDGDKLWLREIGLAPASATPPAAAPDKKKTASK